MPVSSVAIMPPLIEPGDPDFAVVRNAVQEKIAKSEAADAKAANPNPTPSASASPKAKKKPKADRPRTAQTSNLAKVCAA